MKLNIRMNVADEAKVLANKGLEEIEILRQQLRLLQAGVATDSAELREELAELRTLLKEGMPGVALVSQRFNTPRCHLTWAQNKYFQLSFSQPTSRSQRRRNA